MKATSERLLTVVEAATRLGLKEATIRRRILERKIAYCKVGRAVRLPQEEIERMIKESWRDPVPETGQRSK
ncbi:MAG: helix-turn-helix domain-containing protein [Nitrospira sp.]|nr:helix-turn-helix domain-containing protein [Nitrospira sp.]